MNALKRAIPTAIRRWLRNKQGLLRKKLLWIDKVTDFSQLRRTTPYRLDNGQFRGQCIDRFYIEHFLEKNAADIKGHVLEVHDPKYTLRYGGSKVTCSDILDADATNTEASLIANLEHANSINAETFDCIVFTQTLQLIYDFNTAIRNLYCALKPGGVLLATFPGLAQHTSPSMIAGIGKDYWRFTKHSSMVAFGTVFGDSNLSIYSYGNVLTSVGFLHGLVSEELTRKELECNDPVYELIIAVRATKAIHEVQA